MNIIPRANEKVNCLHEYFYFLRAIKSCAFKKYTSKVKASRGTIASILGNEGNIKIRQAIDNAKELQKYWSDHNYEYYNNVKIMNPSTSIHELVEVLLDEIEDVCK